MIKHKRKNFFQVFISKFLISIPIIAVLLIIAISFLHYNSNSVMNSHIGSLLDDEYISRSLSEGPMSDQMGLLQLKLSIKDATLNYKIPGARSFAYFTDADGNTIIDSSARGYLLISSTNENSDERERNVYTLNLDLVDSSDELKKIRQNDMDFYADSALEYLSPQKKNSYKITMKKGVIDTETNEFYPENIIVEQDSYITMLASEMLTEESLDTGDNSNMVTIEFDSPDLSSQAVEHYTDDGVSKKLGDKDVSSFLIYVGSYYKTDEVLKTSGPLDSIVQSSREYTDTNGDKYVLHYIINDNFTRSYASLFVVIGIIFLLVDVVGCLMISSFNYNKLKSFYINEDYRSSLMNSMAHDLKTPLTAMAGYAENLKENVQTDKREHYADAILENTEYMNNIINDILRLIKLEDEHSENKNELIDFCEIAKAQAKHIEPMLKEKDISLSIEDSYTKKADKAYIERIMDNLLCNAVTYTKEGGKIRIYTKQGRAGKKEFIIENTPCEPVDVNPEKLWEPFIKGDPSRSEKKGSGLGLSITKNILDNFGYRSEIKINKDCFSVIIK